MELRLENANEILEVAGGNGVEAIAALAHDRREKERRRM